LMSDNDRDVVNADQPPLTEFRCDITELLSALNDVETLVDRGSPIIRLRCVTLRADGRHLCISPSGDDAGLEVRIPAHKAIGDAMVRHGRLVEQLAWLLKREFPNGAPESAPVRITAGHELRIELGDSSRELDVFDAPPPPTLEEGATVHSISLVRDEFR